MSAPRDLEPSSSVLAFFGAELRRLRADGGFSQEELGGRVSYSGSLVGMVETARRSPSRDFAVRCDEALQTGGALARLWPLVSQEALPRWFRPFAEVEREATGIRAWEPLLIPGLLQTADYARALLAGCRPGDSREAVEQQVTARMERQQLLGRPDPPLMWTIISEAALRNPVGGPEILAGQLARLAVFADEFPKIIIQVVPQNAGSHPGLEGPMFLVARRGQPDVAYLEVQGRGHLVESGEEVAWYGLLYDVLRAVALPPDKSRDMITGLAEGGEPCT